MSVAKPTIMPYAIWNQFYVFVLPKVSTENPSICSKSDLRGIKQNWKQSNCRLSTKYEQNEWYSIHNTYILVCLFSEQCSYKFPINIIIELMPQAISIVFVLFYHRHYAKPFIFSFQSSYHKSAYCIFGGIF